MSPKIKKMRHHKVSVTLTLQVTAETETVINNINMRSIMMSDRVQKYPVTEISMQHSKDLYKLLPEIFGTLRTTG